MADASTTNASWEDKLWMQHHPLNRETVMFYFAGSLFYDRTCNNEQVKMQRPGQHVAPEEMEAALERMSGVEYRLHHADEVAPTALASAHSLYVIHRQERTGPPPLQPVVQRQYYVLDGVVYEVPSLRALLGSRVQKLGWLLKDAFDECWAAARGVQPGDAAEAEAGAEAEAVQAKVRAEAKVRGAAKVRVAQEAAVARAEAAGLKQALAEAVAAADAAAAAAVPTDTLNLTLALTLALAPTPTQTLTRRPPLRVRLWRPRRRRLRPSCSPSCAPSAPCCRRGGP